MPSPIWSGQSSRKVVKRILVKGNLVLQTPARFGNGDSDDFIDMPLLVDALDGISPLLTGASIAGALRSYLRSLEMGNFEPNNLIDSENHSAAVALFGGIRMDAEGDQSPLIVSDARGTLVGSEVRPGVGIDPVTRTAEDDKLFNAEYWHAGTSFPIRFELAINQNGNEEILRQALAASLKGLEDGDITLGARKSRGFGRCRVSDWQVIEYDMTNLDGLMAWLGRDEAGAFKGSSINELLKIKGPFTDQRRWFQIKAVFEVDGSLLIRSTPEELDGPDFAHLHSMRPDKSEQVPILSGTSLAGALRARALRIARTLNLNDPGRFVDRMFGAPPEKNKGKGKMGGPTASRLRVTESEIQNIPVMDDEFVQGRVKIDRFTGGAFPSALFHEQPFYPQADSCMELELTLLEPEDSQIGLLMYLLKDLWTGDLALGGESGVGRGRLKGIRANIELHEAGQALKKWLLEQDLDSLVFKEGKPEDFDPYAEALLKEVSHE